MTSPPVKRNVDDVLSAIAAAHAETRGRILDQIDRVADAETAAARRLVSVTLQDYSAEDADGPKRAEARFRKEMERVLGGALPMVQAFRAFTMARESEPEELSPTERQLAEAWLAAMPRAHAAGVDGLGPAPTAWFEARAVRPDSPPRSRTAAIPRQSNLF
jgi:hypothetical protein